jgi:hypothetical protein
MSREEVESRLASLLGTTIEGELVSEETNSLENKSVSDLD